MNIESVRIELSNVCNLKCKGCPSTVVEKKHHLPFKIVEKVLKELLDMKFTGMIGFHRYNEPLIDPRLFKILDITPFPVVIWTNGTVLTSELKDELKCETIITDHSKCELDSRLDIYNWSPVKAERCGRKNQLTISHTGDVVLCCYDWKDTVSFGSVKDESLVEIIKRIPDKRDFDVCKRCNNWK